MNESCLCGLWLRGDGDGDGDCDGVGDLRPILKVVLVFSVYGTPMVSDGYHSGGYYMRFGTD